MTVPAEPHSDYRLNVKKPSLLTLIVLISYGSIGTALFTPAIPSVMDRFHVGAGIAQLTVMLFLLGYSLGQLIYSPVAKRYGRKPALYVGIGVSLIGNFLCILAGYIDDLTLLVLARLITSLGSSVGLSLTFMIISDYYYESHARKVTAYTMLAFAVVPGVGIAIGGFLVAYLGWISCFYFLFLYGVFALFLAYRLAETSTEKESDSFSLRRVIKAYLRDFKNPILSLYSIMIGTTTAFIYTFAATAPVIGIRMMGLSPDVYGIYNLIPAAGYFLGNFIAARLSSHCKIKTVLKLGIFMMALGILIFAALFFLGFKSPWNLFLPVFIIYFGSPLFYSNAAVIATFRVPDKPNASSIMSFINIGCAVLGLALLEVAHGNPMIMLSLFFILGMIFILFLFRRGQKLIED
ncbi:MAG: MFS transporter [Chlamydiia bacterium]|nr:MFS transporter [Chlamydiia bacterium]